MSDESGESELFNKEDNREKRFESDVEKFICMNWMVFLIPVSIVALVYGAPDLKSNAECLEPAEKVKFSFPVWLLVAGVCGIVTGVFAFFRILASARRVQKMLRFIVFFLAVFLITWASAGAVLLAEKHSCRHHQDARQTALSVLVLGITSLMIMVEYLHTTMCREL